MCEREFSFYFIKLSWNHFSYERIEVGNLYKAQFCQFCDENIMYLAFKFALTKNQSV